MKLISIYTNKENIFPRIRFNDGLNVVFARVKKPLIREFDSHNLGKTFLIHVIDFLLLSNIDNEHPFKKNSDLFGDFVFYLQIKTNEDKYVTVSRKASGRGVVNLYVNNDLIDDLRDLPDENWTYSGLSVDKGRQELDVILNLSVIKPYTYRKGLGYFLRSQGDYNDEFRISGFTRGKDVDWKPYLATVLGFDYEVIKSKYEVDYEIDQDKRYLDYLESEAGSTADEYDEIRGMIEITEDKANRLREDIDGFSFREIESEINEEIVHRIEQRIADLNEERYTTDYELQEIDKSLKTGYSFDIEKIQEIFKEVSVIFPDSLLRDYQQLMDFNRRLSSDREERLRELSQRLTTNRQIIDHELIRLDHERKAALDILKERETLKKYRQLQGRLLRYEQEMNDLRQQLSTLDLASNVQKKIDRQQRGREDLTNKIQELVRGENRIYSSIR